MARGGFVSTPASTAGLVEALRRHGVIGASAPLPPEDHAQDRAWFVSLLQGIVGWIAGLLLLAFVGIMWSPDTTGEILAVGVVLLIGAWALYFIDRNAVFLDQLALAISIAGQFACGWAIFRATKSTLSATGALLALQGFVYLVMPNKVARTIAMFFAC